MLSKSLDNNELIQLLPHKHPFIMVDQVTDFEIPNWIKGIKVVSHNQAFSLSNNHIMICESLAQLSKILDILSTDSDRTPISYLTSIKTDFLQKIKKGDIVELYIKWTNNYKDMSVFEAQAYIKSIQVLKGSLIRKININQ